MPNSGGWWVAWSKSTWGQPDGPDFAYNEALVMAHPLRSSQYVTVLFHGISQAIAKNLLYRVKPIIDVEDMHTAYDYNS